MNRFSNISRTAAKNFIKRKLKNLAVSFLAPFLPALITAGIVFFVAVFISVAIYAQLTGGQTLVSGLSISPTDEDIKIKELAIKNAEEKNNENTWVGDVGGERLGKMADAYGRDVQLALTWGHVYTAAMLDNTINGRAIDPLSLDLVSYAMRPIFKYMAAPKIVEKRVVEEIEEDENGNKKTKKIERWETVLDTTEYLLTEADTIFGHFYYTYKKVVKEEGDTRITYMQPDETRIFGEENGRLKYFLKKKFNLREDDIDIQVKMFMEASMGFVEERERLEWLMSTGAGMYNFISYATVPPEFFPTIKEIAEKYGIPVWFICGIIQVESSFNPMAENDKSGAFGLMQVMPENWEAYAPKLGYDVKRDKLNPKAQLDVGVYLLKNYIGKVDFDSITWKEDTLKGLARYGGYGDDVERARDYAEKIWSCAEAFKMSYSGNIPWPVPGYNEITSPFGVRIHPITGEVSEHTGIDIAAPIGTPALSVANGKVVFAGKLGAYGQAVVIRDLAHDYLYGHLSSILVKEGDVVTCGQVIAHTGNTGISTGPHLHFGVSIGDFRNDNWIDPVMVIQK